ncbi:MAG: hypothetical protein JWQ71_868 [Pedosphaera sp.]|nr:hypothetical protein [Pedosphaera sp.]
MYSTALAFGCMIASLEALRPSGTGFSFEVTFRTLIAFMLGGTIAFPFWRLILNGSNWSQRKLTIVGVSLVLLLLLLGVGAFLYPLRFVPKDKLPEIRTGLITAVFALSGVGLLLWGVKRFIDSDEKQEELRH